MRVLVIGGGGREHALVWAIHRSPRVDEVVCAPGNGGIAALARCVPADLKDVDDLLRVVHDVEPDLTVVGPELPLGLGLVDEMQRRGLRVFGPTQRAAMLETSKAFAKEFMQRHHIPTANYAICETLDEVRDALGLLHAPVVVKADGLAAGKGVVICHAKDEAAKVAAEMLGGRLLGSPEPRVVLEEFLEGEELSFLVLCDGEHVAPLVPSQDHKRVGEGDKGANTGGMGAYSTDALLEPEMRDWLVSRIAQPVVDGMAAEGAPFTGILYCGLMMTARGPMVLEFNARFGDPETQAVLLRLESDLVEAFEAAIEARVSENEMRWSPDASACVILASEGYPGPYRTGMPIAGLEAAKAIEGVEIFHSGTALVGSEYVTTGGRVLGVCARGADLAQAVQRAYAAVSRIRFDGMYYRRDIARRALRAGQD